MITESLQTSKPQGKPYETYVKSPAFLRTWIYLGELRVSGLIQTRYLIGEQLLQTSGRETRAEFCPHSAMVFFSWADSGEVQGISGLSAMQTPQRWATWAEQASETSKQVPFSVSRGLSLEPMMEEAS